MVCIAEAMHRDPVNGLRVVFLSAGAEEALQEGIRGCARTHFTGLGRDTWFINLESVGSGRLVLLEGEGPVRTGDYGSRSRRRSDVRRLPPRRRGGRVNLRRGWSTT